MDRGALLDPTGRFRYELWRQWTPFDEADSRSWPLTVIMLNPSTADARFDDRTILRCISFAKREGLGGLRVVNLYAFRSADPAKLWTIDDPVGPENDHHLERALMAASEFRAPVLVAWGQHARADRVDAVLALADRMGVTFASLGANKGGSPKHPLYVAGAQALEPWPERSGPEGSAG